MNKFPGSKKHRSRAGPRPKKHPGIDAACTKERFYNPPASDGLSRVKIRGDSIGDSFTQAFLSWQYPRPTPPCWALTVIKLSLCLSMGL